VPALFKAGNWSLSVKKEPAHPLILLAFYVKVIVTFGITRKFCENMRKKKHNADEIRFCQSRLHKRLYEFQDGETSFLVNVEWENGQPLRMVVCHDCFRCNIGSLIKEIIIEKIRVPA